MVIARNSNLLGKITILVMVGLCVDTAAALNGSGTEEDPWKIESLADFDEFAADPNYWYDYTNLETDINLAGRTYTTAVIAPDTSSSGGFQGTGFTGVFDGNDCIISSLQISGGGYLGLFGFLRNEGRIKNLGLVSGSVRGTGNRIGSLVGHNWDGLISNCYSEVDVNGVSYVGGLVGDNFDGVVSNCSFLGDVSGGETVGGLMGVNGGNVLNCYFTGDVNGLGYVGGLVGQNYPMGTVSNCYSNVTINGVEYVGGLVGYNWQNISTCYSTGTINGYEYIGGLVGRNTAYVSHCYSICSVNGGAYVGCLVGDNHWGSVSNSCSTGDVNGVSSVGGLIGVNSSFVRDCYSTACASGNDCIGGLVGQNGHFGFPPDGHIYNSYSTGRVQGDSNVGGLVGKHEDGYIERSFWDIQTSGQLESDGGIGKMTGEMQTKSTFTDVGWDFVGETANGTEDIWTMHDGVDYPKFVWELVNFIGWYEVDFADYAFFANRWQDSNCGVANDCDGADLDFSDKVDGADMKIFFDHWMEGVE